MAQASMATYESGDTQRAPGRLASSLAGKGPSPRVRDHGGAAGRQRRAVRSANRHHISGAAPVGARRPGARHLVDGGWTPTPRVPADPRWAAHAGRRTWKLAAVLRRRHRCPDAPLLGSDIVTAGQQLIDAYRSEEHTSELQSHHDLVCRLLLEKKKDPDQIDTAVHHRQKAQIRA